MTWTKGSAMWVTTSASGGASRRRAACRRPAVAAGHELVERGARGHVDVPDHVDQAFPAPHRAVQTGDGVDEDVAAGQHLVGEGVAEQRVRGRGYLALGQGAAPGHIARIGTPGGRLEPGAGDGTDAVRADEQVRFGPPPGRERHAHAIAVLTEVGDFGAQLVPAGAEDAEQGPVHGVPRREPVPVRLFVLDAAVAVQEADPAGARAHVLGAQAAALHQVLQRAVQHGESRAARGEGGRRALEDADVTARVAEHQRRRQGADRAADDADGRHRGYGRPNVATLTTAISNSTRRSSMDGSRKAYGGSLPVYFTQIRSS